MALGAYSLISTNELKASIGGAAPSETKNDVKLENICNTVTRIIEAFLDRQIVTRGSMTSYFNYVPSGFCGESRGRLWLREYPVITVTSVHETASRTYDSTTLLVANTDYVVSPAASSTFTDPVAYLIRTSSATDGPKDWLCGWRAIKVIYSAGYADTASVPEAIKRQAVEIGKRLWSMDEHVGDFAQTETTPLGTVQRYPMAMLTKNMQDALQPYRRIGHFTYEERSA